MTLVPLGDAEGRDSWVVGAPDGRRFAVFRVDGGLRVTDAVCPHNQGPLDQGWLRDGRVVVCPWHWYRFDLDTGECETTPQHRLGTYPVVEHDGARFADVGAPPAERSWADRLRAHARGEG
ncbi:Rieske (2Fe-2S) protein [Pseudonocardia hydrocarbonoxydans]|uniref:Rieske domain-containing protein n=1 Tax=Pseudonocardia hydrocarbonoxydans TaxID=76726 RepID=A0A4Y3WLP5_9PSEU|nr:Rieske 2Fe-2S domain-containing protein [Pseudonocardia hydrocarbonoxydans]GEC19763.1 hypothetical protein PHY01_20460 [Pseudonocardia hydrocarbonoxydans]